MNYTLLNNLTPSDFLDPDNISILVKTLRIENNKAITTLTRTLAILGIIICMIGIVGNLFSMIVLSRKSMSRLSTYSYLLGLSICDEISLFFTIIIFAKYSLPSTIDLSDSFNNNYKLLQIYIYPIVASMQALSVWITLAFTIDRYLYVCQPYYGIKHCTRRRSTIIIICLYLLAAIYSIPQFLERSYDIVDILGTEHIFGNLTALGRNKYFIYVYHVFIYCIFVCFIPFTTIFVLNVFLIYDIIKSNRRRRDMSLRFLDATNLNLLNGHDVGNGVADLSIASRHSVSYGEWRHYPSKLLACFKKKSANAQDPQVQDDTIGNTNNIIITGVTEPCLSPNNRRVSCAVSEGRKPSVSIFRNRKQSVNFTDKKIRNDVTIMLVGLIVVFFICHAPSTVLRLITFQDLKITFNPLFYNSQDVSNFLVVTNSTLNCILYIMLGKKFRKEFLATFFSKCIAVYKRHKETSFMN